MDLALCHTSDMYSFEVAPRFLENFDSLLMNCSNLGGLSFVVNFSGHRLTSVFDSYIYICP